MLISAARTLLSYNGRVQAMSDLTPQDPPSPEELADEAAELQDDTVQEAAQAQEAAQTQGAEGEAPEPD